jgi:hypothetical protein
MRDLAHLPEDVLLDMADDVIRQLDELQGDPDLEETDAEDSFALSWYAQGHGAGCPVSDPGGGNVEDEGEQVNEDGVDGYFCD